MPSATVSNATTHIPAWKRLGLKLKSVQTTPDIVESTIDQETPKRKSSGPIENETPSKRLKKNPNPGETTVLPVTPQLARKKSVTFTDETKTDDGDSIKQLYKSWVAEQQLQDPDFELKNSAPVFQIPTPPRVEEQVDSNLSEKERKVKRVKKPKEEKPTPAKPKKPSKATTPTQVTPAITSRPFLEYWKQYSQARDSWKFNKNHQNHLLKHIFNVEVVPLAYGQYIYEYVRGLQGGVRTRLRDTALSVKVKDLEDGAAGFPEKMADSEQRQQEYDTAMKDYVATMAGATIPDDTGYDEGVLLGLSHKAMQGRAAKRMRAERILAELAASPDRSGTSSKVVNGEDESQKRLRMNDGTSQKLPRKRKQRINATVDDGSSDDSSDSESSSDDDSTAENEAPEEETSSSSSSSSSEGDSDDDDDDDDNDDDGSESDSSDDSDGSDSD
jgi:hypothetical protein